MTKKSIIIFSLIISCMPACIKQANLKNGLVEKRHAKFGVELLKPPWQLSSFRGADIFIEHKPSGSAIFVNSVCEKIGESPLEALRAQLMVGFENIEIQDQKHIDLAERQALVSELTATVDGVERFLKIMVLRKNRCIFDAVLSSPEKNPQMLKDFDLLIGSFWAEAEL